MFKPYRTVLDNGMRIVTVPMKDTKTVTVLVLVEAGTFFETKKTNGISHFLEHMCFKGTTKRPTAHIISHEFDSIGADSNALTTGEYTGYYAKSRVRHFEQILDIVSDVYLDPTFPTQEIEKEKGVILEEINMYEDTPSQTVHDVFSELLYGDQPAGWNTLGTKENIKRFGRRDFVKYRTGQYRASATTVVIAGGIEKGKALSAVRKAFAILSDGKKGRRSKTIYKQTKPQIKARYKKTDQTHFVLGFPSYNTYDKKRTAVRLLATSLGQGMSSRLFQKLREEMGVCYYVGSYAEANRDAGIFKITSGVDTKRLPKVVEVILEETKSLRDVLISKSELEKVQEYMIGSIEMGLESSDDIASYYGTQEIYGKELKEPEEYIKDIKSITTEDIQNVARELFRIERLNLALVGPQKSVGDLLKKLKI